ncbi:MAG TPA: TPM domain-containing protein [Bacteroidales bacterium]|nr:TPM domain-containing protein [Bacteroidales bacterium]
MPSNFFTKEQKAAIVEAIGNAEQNTSGEIRIHIDKSCKEEVLDQAAYIFKKLKMHKTEQRNGVLIYLALDDRKFAIIGDAGINSKVPADFWDKVKDEMLNHFKLGEFSEGLITGIQMAGEKLKAFFPLLPDDKNELSDEISFGK